MKITSIKNYSASFEGKYKNYSYITDPGGRFYAGMTLQEARADGTDSSFWRRDFGNLDKDMDGVLSVDEIFKERNREIKNHKISAGLFAGLAAIDAFIPTSSAAEKIFFLLLDFVIIASDLAGIHNISKGNERYARMIAENREFADSIVTNA